MSEIEYSMSSRTNTHSDKERVRKPLDKFFGSVNRFNHQT